jgi:hypothetical protein
VAVAASEGGDRGSEPAARPSRVLHTDRFEEFR